MASKILNYPVNYIRGIKFRFPFPVNTQYLEDGVDYRPLNDDIILITYKKCGTHWMYYLVKAILNHGLPDRNHVLIEFAGELIKLEIS